MFLPVLFTAIIIAFLIRLIVYLAKAHNRLVVDNELMRMTLVQDYGRTEFNHDRDNGHMSYVTS